MVFAKHETLDPIGWDQTARVLRMLDALPCEKREELSKFYPTESWPSVD